MGLLLAKLLYNVFWLIPGAGTARGLPPPSVVLVPPHFLPLGVTGRWRRVSNDAHFAYASSPATQAFIARGADTPSTLLISRAVKSSYERLFRKGNIKQLFDGYFQSGDRTGAANRHRLRPTKNRGPTKQLSLGRLSPSTPRSPTRCSASPAQDARSGGYRCICPCQLSSTCGRSKRGQGDCLLPRCSRPTLLHQQLPLALPAGGAALAADGDRARLFRRGEGRRRHSAPSRKVGWPVPS